MIHVLVSVFETHSLSNAPLVPLFQTFVEGHRFFEQYEMIFTALKQAADVYVRSDSSSKSLFCFITKMFVIYMLYICRFMWSYY